MPSASFTLITQRFLLLVVVAFLTLSLFSPAQAEQLNSETLLTDTPQLPEAIEHLENKGLTVIDNFKVGASLEGWVVSFAGQEQIIYTTSDGEYLINGVVLDAQGNDLTNQHQKTWLSQANWESLSAASFISNAPSNPKTTLYVFFDANCPFCQLAWLALQPYVEAGLEVRWLPVAYLQPSSKPKAAGLLSSPKQEQSSLLAKLMQPADYPNLDLPNFTPENLNQLEENTRLMRNLGLNATPAWVWQNEDGALESFAGMLRLPRIAEITGLPKQKHPEPSLMRFR